MSLNHTMYRKEERKDVVILGNGPSAISLSYFLAGNWPYYQPDQLHPNEYLHTRLTQGQGGEEQEQGDGGKRPRRPSTSLVEQDLEYLSNGLQGRSINPVSVLFDTLQHPEADFGAEMPSTLSWRFHPEKAVDHVVLGKGEPGGAWDQMDDCMETLTVSVGNWMQLPKMPIKQWHHENKRSETRMSLGHVAKYYKDYVRKQGLRSFFRDYSEVTDVHFDHDSQEWHVFGRQKGVGQFKYVTPKLVLATGNADTSTRLAVPGEQLPFVFHSLNQLEQLLSTKDTGAAPSEPILIVGAGLSAADAIIAARFKHVPVIHAFRRHPDDPALIFNQLPENMYPEYHKVHSRMKGATYTPGYKAFPMHSVCEIKPNKEVVLKNLIGADDTHVSSKITIKVSNVLIMIGKNPDLHFFRPNSDRLNLGIHPLKEINARSNPIDINPYSHESNNFAGLYAMGPLVGDNFVRFLQGAALAITNHIWRERRERSQP